MKAFWLAALQTVVRTLIGAMNYERVKVLVGGAPVTRQFADEIGADGYGENASVAVSLARTLTAPAAIG